MLIYTNQRSKKKPKSKTKKELTEYETWLKSVKSMDSGLQKRKYGGSSFKDSTDNFTSSTQVSSRKKATYVTGACTTGGIMKDYHKMSKSDREIVDNLATCVAPLHKSNYVYVSEGMNPASLGRKNEVL